MQFSASTVATIIAFTGLVSAAPATEKRAAAAQVGAAWTDALPNQLMKMNVLWYKAYLPPAWSMTAWGQYNTCYNTPAPYSQTTGSVDMAGGAQSCWIFADANCPANGKTQEVKSDGINVFEGAIGSIYCDGPTTA